MKTFQKVSDILEAQGIAKMPLTRRLVTERESYRALRPGYLASLEGNVLLIKTPDRPTREALQAALAHLGAAQDGNSTVEVRV